jgi:hypothetical protein
MRTGFPKCIAFLDLKVSSRVKYHIITSFTHSIKELYALMMPEVVAKTAPPSPPVNGAKKKYLLHKSIDLRVIVIISNAIYLVFFLALLVIIILAIASNSITEDRSDLATFVTVSLAIHIGFAALGIGAAIVTKICLLVIVLLWYFIETVLSIVAVAVSQDTDSVVKAILMIIPGVNIVVMILPLVLLIAEIRRGIWSEKEKSEVETVTSRTSMYEKSLETIAHPTYNPLLDPEFLKLARVTHVPGKKFEPPPEEAPPRPASDLPDV